MKRTRVLNVVYRSATALGSHLPSIASAKARVASAGALLQPVSTRTQVNIFIWFIAPENAIHLLWLFHFVDNSIQSPAADL